ncbi:HPP family protein [Agrobacterium vitis]|uniref:HPP family protein n=1 Tax=Agrobacterium vitis TaxID=373 RepID=UPI001326A859|nr:HPP family protein [Agrobacterium vitis]
MRHYFHRHQPFSSFTKALLAGFGGCLAIGILSFLTTHTGYALMMAPFGASCVLLFSLPNSPLSQPMNVFFGHLASALVGLLCATLLPDIWWAVALAVGGAISVMALLRITHPPAGADPIVVFAAHASWQFLFMPVALGSLLLIACAVLFHRSHGQAYPMRKSN